MVLCSSKGVLRQQKMMRRSILSLWNMMKKTETLPRQALLKFPRKTLQSLARKTESSSHHDRYVTFLNHPPLSPVLYPLSGDTSTSAGKMEIQLADEDLRQDLESSQVNQPA